MPIGGRPTHFGWYRWGIHRKVSEVVQAISEALEKLRFISGSYLAAEISRSRRFSWKRPERLIPDRNCLGLVSPPPMGPSMKGIPR